VEFLRALSERHGVRYLKVAGAEIFLAKGFESDGRDGARHLAEVALQARQESARLLHRAGGLPGFSIGLDFGAALGSRVGAQPSVFNVWGPALRTAALMAETAAPGTIQATESIYREIGDRFTFRHRGGFFVENCGEMDTYVLQARQ
jgi:class 3 adenylate cyclase